ncbi:heavy metal sensor histidine kinase [Yersinia enterocolitica]
MFRRSISVHMALMFALSALLIVSAIGILLRSSLHDSLQKQMHNELLFRESLMSPWIIARTSAEGWSILANKFTVLASSEGERVRYWIVSDNPRFSVGGPPPAGVDWSSLQEGFNKIPGTSEGVCSLFLLVKTIPANGERPALRYVVAIDSTPYMGTLDAFTRTLLIITALGVLIVALLGYAVSRIGLRPVGALSQQAQHLAPGDHGQRLDATTLPQELQQLATSFNGVLERQEIAWRQLESFNADVAHELRTPLTNLIGQTQLGLSRRRSPEELEELLGSNLEELERMTSIVNDMLFLSHAHAGDHAAQLTHVSLREETLKTAEYVEPSFAEKQLSLKVEGDVIAHIDRRLFHRSLANLLENSARHSSPESTITVQLSKNGNQASVAVSNPGDPIAATHLHRLFERFYRVDSSRTKSDTHHGLGLSIVRAVAIMHRGDVFARSESGINTFGLTFALSADDELSTDGESCAEQSQLSAKEPENTFSASTDNIVRQPSA